jgi:acyl-coenzyme A thioesterase PaaI-like protein
MMPTTAIQDHINNNHCVGCGPDNPRGLRIKSHWVGDLETSCSFQPQPHMAAGPESILNGGIIATLIDCHAVCTAISYAARLAGGAAGKDDTMFVTASLSIRYRRPTPIDRPVEVRARIVGVAERRTVLECTLSSDGTVCAEATVVAARAGAGSAAQPQRVPPPAQTLGGWKVELPSPRPLAKTA